MWTIFPQMKWRQTESCKLLCTKTYKSSEAAHIDHLDSIKKIIAQDYQQHWLVTPAGEGMTANEVCNIIITIISNKSEYYETPAAPLGWLFHPFINLFSDQN